MEVADEKGDEKDRISSDSSSVSDSDEKESGELDEAAKERGEVATLKNRKKLTEEEQQGSIDHEVPVEANDQKHDQHSRRTS